MDFTKNIQDELEHIKLLKQEQLEEEIDQLVALLKLCGRSPLEQQILLDFVVCFDGSVVNFEKALKLHGIFIGPELAFHPNLSKFYLEITPQYKITAKSREGRKIIEKKYRADFLIELKEKATNLDVIKLIVEVDGHDYHERTKEQAQHDKERDRSFLSLGYPTMRFTGREIYSDTVKATSEIEKYLLEKALGVLGESPKFK